MAVLSRGTLLAICLIAVALIYKKSDDIGRDGGGERAAEAEPAKADAKQHFTARIAIG